MARSIKLSHCVCNPKLPCPCPTFTQYNTCACAGEKAPVKSGPIALTRYVRKAGCASKIGQADLLRILGNLPMVDDPNVLLGAAAGDDAGVYRIDDRTALVQTVDVFTPVVDDPYLFGQIAAANSVSDVYAMGGRPLTALSIVGFPIDELDGAIMEAILRGGLDKMREAGCAVIGGHSIDDEEIKFGYAVTGLIDPRRVVARGTAKPGDALVITKPLGTGMISFAAQLGRVSRTCLDEAGASMATLNKDAAELMLKHGANACTDITGFALAGHLVEMIRASGVSAEIDLSAVPVFGAVEACLENEILSGAIERNEEYSMAWVETPSGNGGRNLAILYDPQTSGGLLVSLPVKAARKYVAEMRKRGHAATSIIGRIVERGAAAEGKITITNTGLRNFIGKRESVIMKNAKSETTASKAVRVALTPATDAACCANPPDFEPGTERAEGETTIASDSLKAFSAFMKSANTPGAIDARAKKLMAIALSVAMRCKPCQLIHVRNALAMGISMAEIHEAANLAISFAGCPALMLFKEVCEETKI